MRIRRLLFGADGTEVQRDLDRRAFEPVTESANYTAPRAAIDPDQSRSWLVRAWPVIKAHRTMWFASLFMSFIALLAQVQIPRLIGQALSSSLPAQGHTTGLRPLAGPALEILVMIGVREIGNYAGRRSLLATAYRFEFDLRHLIYQRYMALSFPFYDQVSVGELISRANSDVRAVQQYLVMAPTVLVQCSVILVAMAEMFSLNIQLALVIALSLPITFGIGLAMRRRIHPVSWLIQARLAVIAAHVEETAAGIRVVKSFAAEQQQLNELARSATELEWAYTKDADIESNWAPVLENLPRAGLAVILLYGGILVSRGQLSVGTLFTFQAYMLIFQPPFRQLGMVIMNGQRASASAKRIYEILDHPIQIVNRPGAVHLAGCRGEIRFDKVGFTYPDGTRVLDDFTMRIAPGETVALVGRTGSGKTTVGRLLNRSYDTTSGSLSVDGRDVREYTLESLRASVGLVFDESFLFSVSIRDNIAYGRPGAAMSEIIAAAKAADADEFIARLPDGYDTVVGERGYTLSGGQRQRVAIARTLLVNPPVLVLDDATSAIDVQVEHRIHVALRELMATRTTVIIAHRLATIALADRVVLVEQGRAIATGRHEELLATSERYADVLAHAERIAATGLSR